MWVPQHVVCSEEVAPYLRAGRVEGSRQSGQRLFRFLSYLETSLSVDQSLVLLYSTRCYCRPQREMIRPTPLGLGIRAALRRGMPLGPESAFDPIATLWDSDISLDTFATCSASTPKAALAPKHPSTFSISTTS